MFVFDPRCVVSHDVLVVERRHCDDFTACVLKRRLVVLAQIQSHLLHSVNLLIKELLHFPHTPEGTFADLTQTIEVVAELGG